MVEHEMKWAGKLILCLLRRDDPTALDRFVENHTHLLTQIVAKADQVEDALHRDDLVIEHDQLVNLQNMLPVVQEKVALVLNNGLVDVQGHEKQMTLHCLYHWYECAMDKLIWAVVYPEKVDHMLAELGTLVLSLRKKKMLAGIRPDQKDDLHIMEGNMSLLYSFLHGFHETPAFSGKRILKRSCLHRGHSWVKRATNGRRAHCRK